ncbi:MAG: arginine repressor [Eubacteriaceae bacterium]|jgi:transcriptional regulator of arginine metabolism|nr:arginine repressor [Eubacteriaceae bacterium]
MKIDRHSKILSIIDENVVETQEELTDLLRRERISVTQATVSRDIRELRLIKVKDQNGRYKYAPYENESAAYDERIVSIFREAVLTIDTASNFVCIHTITGMAQAAAVAIDSLKSPSVIGSVAGDDTIFVMARSEAQAADVAGSFRQILKGMG